MIFSSPLFMFLFLPVSIAGYFFCNNKIRNTWLFVVSLFFYSFGEPRFAVLMLISIILNYYLGIGIEQVNSSKIKNLLMCITVIIDVGILMIFKYSNFIIENLNLIDNVDITPLNISLPIGISFYTFQILSYVIDVYRRDTKAQRNIINLGLYISLFPQLIAGPIVRYIDVEKQIKERNITIDKFYSGIRRFMLGFIKKVLVADVVSVVADVAFTTSDLSAPLAWLGIIAYTIQIYFDFSGYSDMAIGLGKIFGFDFVENFNYPYISSSVQEFWRRWHISLSTWFKDYVYIPLGGSRCGSKRTYFNLMTVFFLTGFWHGASWNFVVWGIYYGFFLIIERAFFGKLLKKVPYVVSHFYLLIVVIIGWILFRAENLSSAMLYMKALFRFRWDPTIWLHVNMEQVLFMCIGIIFAVPIFEKIELIFTKNQFILDISILLGFVIANLYMVGSGFSPFLYFRF